MKILLTLAATLTTHAIFPADINPKVFRMIGPNATLVTGVNVQRHQQSELGKLFPIPDNAAQSIWVESRDSSKLNILMGPQTGDTDPGENAVALDAFTRIQFFGQSWGEEAERHHKIALAEAARQFEFPDTAPTGLAFRAQQLAGMYDDWFIIEKPLEFVGNTHNSPWPLKYRDDLAKTIEELSGGIRFGSNSEVKVEALMRTDEDAKALAALVLWLPGLVQLIASDALPLLVDIADDVTVRTDGRRVTLACHLAEDKVAELNNKVKALRQREIEGVR